MSETTTRPSAASIAEAAERLDSAARTGHPVPPVRELIGNTDLDAAYAVQQELVRRRRSAGPVVVGRKIGLTSPAVQRQLGVDRPDFGVPFADMDVSDEAEVTSARFMQPKIEAEIAFILGRDLTEAPSTEDARRSVDHAVAALEIVDSRIAEWNISITDTIADNAPAVCSCSAISGCASTNSSRARSAWSCEPAARRSLKEVAPRASAIRSTPWCGSRARLSSSETRCTPGTSCSPERWDRWFPLRPAPDSAPKSVLSGP